MPNEEKIDLVVSAETKAAQTGLQNMTGALSESEKAVQALRQQMTDMAVALDASKIKIAGVKTALDQQETANTRAAAVMGQAAQQAGALTQANQQGAQASAGAAQGISGLLGFVQQFYGAASMGATGVQGLANVLGAINPAAGMAAHAILNLGNTITNLVKQAIPSLTQMQSLTINLQSLAAQELVKAGQFENAEQAMDSAALAANGLLRELRLIDLESPFDDTQVMQTFRSGMAYGFSADQALKLTRASLNMAAGLGKSGAEMAMIGMVMGQMRSVGKLLTQDLRQLQSRGINVADMLKNQLGVSVDQFNAGLASGKYTMDDLLEVFDKFASTNFAGAGERMAKTFEGVKSSLSSLKNVAYTTLLQPSFDKFTAVMADALGVLQDFVFNSGLLEKVGARISAVTQKITDFLQGGVNVVKYLSAAILDGDTANDWLTHIPEQLQGFFQGIAQFLLGLRPAFQDAIGWAQRIWLNLQQVGQAVWQFIKPAFDWFKSILPTINLNAALQNIRDSVNAIGQIIYSLVETIRRLLTGNADTAFTPLRQAVTYVLTWIALQWDRWAANAITWGWNLVVQIANGIINAARSVLATAMNYVGSFIGLFIKPGSPPKKGPLSHIAEWGKGLIETYARSFKTADFGLLKSSLAPLQQALQSAMQAGTLSETEYPQVFAAVRTDVAQLIAEFRKTGEVSEVVLGNIAGRLGEGGEELTKFLRLQLMFQKAQTNLQAVEQEVAAARSRGFVSRELAERLQAAQEQAGAAQDELEWQKEYLGLQQDSVDLQLQLVKAMEKLAGALDKVGKAAAEGAAKAGAGGAAAAMPAVTPSSTNIMDFAGGGAGLGDSGEDAATLETALGGISAEFGEMQKKVQDWLDLPLGDKLRELRDEIAKGLGLSDELALLETFMGLPLATKLSYVKNKLEELTGIDFDTLFDNLKTGVVNLAQRVWTALLTEVPKLIGKIGLFLNRLFMNIITWITTNAPLWGRNIGTGLGGLFGKALTFFFETLPEWLEKLNLWLSGLFTAVGDWVANDALPLARQWLRALNAVVTSWFSQIATKTPDWIERMLDTGSELILGFVAGFVENAPEWAVGLLESGVTFVDTIWQGILDAWDFLTRFREKFRTTVRSIVLIVGIWVADLKEAGKEMVKKIKDGIDSAWDFITYLGGKFATLVQQLKDGAGTIFDGMKNLGGVIVQKVKDGLTEAWDMVVWMSTLLANWWTDLTTGTSNSWLTSGVFGAGKAIIDNLKAGIRNAWTNFISWWQQLLGSLTTPLPGSEPKDKSSPLYGLGKRGAALVKNLQAGIDFSPLNAHLRAQLDGTRRILSDAGMALNMQQSYTFGNVVFPNVRDGRDAVGIERTLSQLTLAGRMTARVGGI